MNTFISAPIAAPLTSAARLIPRPDLSSSDLQQMHKLFSLHFDGITPLQFRRDLDEKNWVLLIERDGKLVGFSTILAYQTSVAGQDYSVIYSGDTIVAPQAWNASTLPRAWIESVAHLREHYPRGSYLWMLITSGFRTYRFLPLFWREFFPRFDAPMPADRQRLIDHLAVARFGHQYDPRTGIVRFDNPQRLKGALAEIPAGRMADPHIAFFAARNPAHAAGDEMVCLTELSPDNLTAAGRRMAAAAPKW